MEEEDRGGYLRRVKNRRRNKRKRKRERRGLSVLLWMDTMESMKRQNITNTPRTVTLFPRYRTSTISWLWSSMFLPLGPSNMGTWSITSVFRPWISWTGKLSGSPACRWKCRAPHESILLTLLLIYVQVSYGSSALGKPWQRQPLWNTKRY